MEQFKIEQIKEGVWSVLDKGMSSFYVIDGRDEAAVIDTGITQGAQIMPVVRSLTEKPATLIVTHAHLDHMYHMDEFETVYMSHRELLLSPDPVHKVGDKELDYSAALDVSTDSRLNIGGVSFEICELAGHTPGSILVWDRNHNLLFTGDAIGSGSGVWMQVNTATSLETYYASLLDAMRWLCDRGGRMKFYGGHNYQQTISKAVPGFNPLNLGLLADMADLTGKLITGEITGSEIQLGRNFGDQVLYASYGRAEMLYTAYGIHNDLYHRQPEKETNA